MPKATWLRYQLPQLKSTGRSLEIFAVADFDSANRIVDQNSDCHTGPPVQPRHLLQQKLLWLGREELDASGCQRELRPSRDSGSTKSPARKGEVRFLSRCWRQQELVVRSGTLPSIYRGGGLEVLR
jgi:hypothetical protein